jgi:hypothetical protein
VTASNNPSAFPLRASRALRETSYLGCEEYPAKLANDAKIKKVRTSNLLEKMPDFG